MPVTAAPFSKQDRPRKARLGAGGWALVTISALLFLRFSPATPLYALDSIDGIALSATQERAELADQNFPGSAYFFAEGAFDPAPGVAQGNNAHVYTIDTSPAAAALPFRGISAMDSYRATQCLTAAIYYEAANEPDEGQRAVAQVVLNRVRHPAWPNTVCGVVYQGSERTDNLCQFTFSCDGALARAPSAAGWARARSVAMRALAGDVFEPVGLATHYHTLAVSPHWAPSLNPVAVVGAHIFYRWKGVNGTARAFTMAYSGRETQSGPNPRRWTAAPVAPVPVAPMWDGYASTPPTVSAPPVSPNPNERDNLPESTIRPEYRNTGRPLI